DTIVSVSRSGWDFSVRRVVAIFIASSFSVRGVLLAAAAPLLSCDCVRGDHLRTLGAQFDEAEQDLVPLLLQRLDGARSDLSMNGPSAVPAPAQGRIDVSGAHDALGNEVINLACQRGLQTVGDMARHLLVEAHRPLSDQCIKFRSTPDCRFRGLCPA